MPHLKQHHHLDVVLSGKKLTRVLLLAGSFGLGIALTGCSAPVPLLKQTQSGQAEGVFSGRTPDTVKSMLIDKCLSAGYSLQEASTNQVICAQTLQDGEQVFATFMLGNAYSTPAQRKIRFTVFQVAQGTKVAAQSWVETQMAMGQVNRAELNSPAQVNSLQSLLFSLGAK